MAEPRERTTIGGRFGAGRPPGETLVERAERIGEAYGLVLTLILVTFVVMMTLPPQGWGGRTAAVAVAALTAVIGLTSSDVRLDRVRLAVIAAVAATGIAVVAKLTDTHELLGVAFLIDAVLLAIATVTILRRVVFATTVEFRTILGAISVFTLLGLLFGFLYLGYARLDGSAFFEGTSTATSSDYLFFSYTTLTTTGYGNLVPANTMGQSLAVMEMLLGQFFLVTLVAGLVSLWRPGARAKEDEETPGGPGA